MTLLWTKSRYELLDSREWASRRSLSNGVLLHSHEESDTVYGIKWASEDGNVYQEKPKEGQGESV